MQLRCLHATRHRPCLACIQVLPEDGSVYCRTQEDCKPSRWLRLTHRAPARQVVWAPASAAEAQEGAATHGGDGNGDGAPAAAEGTGHGSIFVVMAGLVKSSFSTSGGGSQARRRAPGG